MCTTAFKVALRFMPQVLNHEGRGSNMDTEVIDVVARLGEVMTTLSGRVVALEKESAWLKEFIKQQDRPGQ